MLTPKPLILFIDAYDSFSSNIISLLETTLSASIRTLPIDSPLLLTDAALQAELHHYAAVVCGPGPGHPKNEKDVGIMRQIWRLQEQEILPVLGICLGFQSLCLEFGGRVERLMGPQHGIVRRVSHVGEVGEQQRRGIFEGVGEINATLYQSLCADIGQNTIADISWETSKWNTTAQCPDLLPLAWVEHDLVGENNSGIADKRVLVAVQHKTKPFWALQYHPESICTNAESRKVIRNWFRHAQSWNRTSRQTQIILKGPIHGRLATRESLLSRSRDLVLPKETGHARNISRNMLHTRCVDVPAHISVPDILGALQNLQDDQIVLESSNANEKYAGGTDVRGRYSIIGLDINDCMRIEYTAGTEYIARISPRNEYQSLDFSRIEANSAGGIWTYLAHYLNRNRMDTGNKDSPFWGGFMGYTTYELGLEGIDVAPSAQLHERRPDLCFAWVTRSLVLDHVKNVVYLQELALESDNSRVGEWMDYVVAKLETRFLPEESFDPFTITFSNLPLVTKENDILDKMLAMNITLPCGLDMHSLDGQFSGITTARYLRHNNPWSIAEKMNEIEMCGQKIHAQLKNKTTSPSPSVDTPFHEQPSIVITNKPTVLDISAPQNSAYESKVTLCQSSIRAGDSYELCLTDQTTITTTKAPSSSWSLYRTLRTSQPAPFASYIRMGPLTFISASPERFLTWNSSQLCSLRPMKGTVKKSAYVSTLAQATALLDIPKEKAENLMIVDLVRHDLHSVCGSGNVSVPRLLVVEEYKSVFQMISVVEGQLPPAVPVGAEKFLTLEQIKDAEGKRYTGLDVLAASLPPGSMTGAPKKRSCEILQSVEGGRRRSLYSGVVGFADVGGRGDWSVNIRCAYKWDDEDGVVAGEDDGAEDGEVKTEKWHVGAGGAVTALSTPVGEREEMLAKLSGTLGLFS